MAHSTSGRHRAPGRHNPVAELSTIASRAGATGAKASAVLAASGGLVAAFALPASAAPETARTLTKDVESSAPVTPAAVAAPAISAPAVSTPVKGVAVGVTGVTAVAKPKPKPKPKPVVSSTREGALVVAAERSSSERSSAKASRTTTRTAISTSAKQSSSQVVNIARTLLGIAYVYGGDDPSGFDCSGFTQYVFRKAGISLPRTASAQQREGTRVSNPQPGDLVFYGSPAWHVGIYTGGDMMIDSPRTGKSTSERNMFGTPTEFRRY
ncbi:C40 family peptidase [Rothia sp. ARF10]|nr:C40 family peptidase [Rothia sp. ARF10]